MGFAALGHRGRARLRSSKGCARKSAHISCARCRYGPVSLNHAVAVGPEVVTSTMVMWLVAGCMAMPINHLTKHRQRSIRVTAVAVQWCKRWLSRDRESAKDIKLTGGHRDHLTADTHGHCHQPQRPKRDALPPHVANAAHRSLRIVSWQHGTSTRP